MSKVCKPGCPNVGDCEDDPDVCPMALSADETMTLDDLPDEPTPDIKVTYPPRTGVFC